MPCHVRLPGAANPLEVGPGAVLDGDDVDPPEPATIAYEPGSDRVSSVTDPVTGTVDYTYAPTGERLTMTLPGGGTWTYAYVNDASGFGLTNCVVPKDDPNSVGAMLTNITDDQGRRVDYVLDILGTLESIEFNETYNGTNLVSYCLASYYYDKGDNNRITSSHLWLTELKNTWNWLSGSWQSSTLSENDYTMDATGQRLTNKITAADGSSRTEVYGYDELNRLTSVDYGDGETQGYTFDNMGNRLSKTDNVTGNESSTFNAANMLLTRGSNNYTNDADGNTLSGGGRTNTWDSQNRMVSCAYDGNSSQYTYGADGIRRRSVVNGVTTDFALDSSMFVRELRSGSSIATYLTGASGPCYRRDDVAGTVRWYLYDGLGSVLDEVDPNGNITANRRYDVYGSVRSSTGTSTSKHKFVGALGHPSDDETGLIYMQARYLDPAAGEFLSEDPGRSGPDPHLYCSDNPVNGLDPDGRVEDYTFWALILVVVKGAEALGLLPNAGVRAVVEFIASSAEAIAIMKQLWQSVGAINELVKAAMAGESVDPGEALKQGSYCLLAAEASYVCLVIASEQIVIMLELLTDGSSASND
ncbi:MAG TPA: RHS repeat-associated core domain-containing protein [Chthonomonadales bacterium]|nr:RHS repeat-associated core domain-containing protein [Chthonomonadales bacterium]